MPLRRELPAEHRSAPLENRESRSDAEQRQDEDDE
jgi:hypothetical protein